MNVLLSVIGTGGDFYPMLGLALELKKRGHKPSLISVDYFKEEAVSRGIDWRSLGSKQDYINSIENPNAFHPTKGFSFVAKTGIIPSVPILYNIIKEFSPSDTILISSGLCFGARIASEKLGFKHYGVHAQPAVFRSLDEIPKMARFSPNENSPRFIKKIFYWIMDHIAIDPILSEPINSFRKQLGLNPVRSFFGDFFMAKEKNFGLFPEWYAKKQLDWPENFAYAGFPLYDDIYKKQEIDPALKNLIENSIIFTAGTANYHAKKFFEIALEICNTLKTSAIFLSRAKQNIPDNLPDHILYYDYIPLSKLLPKAKLLVHHGGIGTLSQAVLAGVPQIISPWSHDQPDNANRIQKLNLGKTLYPNEFSVKNLCSLIEKIENDNQIRKSCSEHSGLLKKQPDAFQTIVDQIEILN